MNEQAKIELEKAYKLMEKGDVLNAKQVLADALEFDLESNEVRFAHWCCSFWAEFIVQCVGMISNSAEEAKDKGNSLISRWEQFKELLEVEETEKTIQPKAVHAIQKGVFTIARDSYLEAEKKSQDVTQDDSKKQTNDNAEIQHRIGLCYKELGEYETALNYLMQANSILPSTPKILADMADCFALYGEEKNAKVLFREAFFIDAQKINILFLESELIQCLIKQVKEKGYTGNALLEWIPVYGILYGVFNVKRQLKPQEVSKLKQDTYSKENEIKDPTNNVQVLTPKLINMYFWLIDYYSRSTEGYAGNEINKYELQIRALDEEIYRLYKK